MKLELRKISIPCAYHMRLLKLLIFLTEYTHLIMELNLRLEGNDWSPREASSRIILLTINQEYAFDIKRIMKYVPYISLMDGKEAVLIPWVYYPRLDMSIVQIPNN